MNVRCKPLVAAISAALATYSVSTLAAYDIDIVPGSYTTGISGTNPFTSIGPAYLSTNRIIAAMTGGANVSVVTGGAGGLDGTINLIGPIDYTGTGANTLSLRAHEDIILDARIGSFIVNNDPLNLVLTADRDNYLGGSVIINNLVRTSGGMFTASGASIYGAGYLDVGTASLTANDGNIVLDDARNDFTTVSSYGQDVTLRDSNSIVLGTTTTGTSALSPGDLTVTASGNITDSGNLAITGAASFTASLGDIVLGNAAGETANFGRITFASAAVVNISEDSATTLTGINTAGDLTLISAGAITKRTAASLDVANHAVLQGTSISLGSESGLVNFGTVDATTTAGSIRIDEDSGMEIAGLRSDRDATMTAAGSIHSWGGDIAVDGTATFVAAGDIVLDTQTSNFGTLRADASAGNGNIFVREDSAMDIAQVTTAGDGMVRLESMDAINDTDNVGVNIAARTIEVAAVNGIGTTSALQIGNAAHLFLATGGGFNVSVTGELDSLGLVLHPATGSSTYVLTNGGLDDFEMIGTDTGLDVSVTDADGLNLHLETGAAVHLRRIDTGSGGLVVAAAGGITDDIGVEVGGATMLDAAGGDITLDSTGNDFTGAVSVSGRNIALRDANALTLGASTVSGDLTLAAGGTVNQTESVSVAGTMTAASTTDYLDYDLAGNQLHAGQ
ncbi:MAG TPA: hypothetical protein VIR60_10905, partial [Gammaproteobacteria bacterium]